MELNEQKDMNQDSNATSNKGKVSKENIFTNFLDFILKKKPWVGTIIMFVISIIVNAVSATSSSGISFFRLLSITFFVTLIIFVCLSPFLFMPLVKDLRRFIIDEDIEKKNLELSEELRGLRDNFQDLSVKFNESIGQNENYFERVISPHIDDCSKIDNLVRRSQMIKNVSDYYQHLTKARENVKDKEVFLTSFSTKPYKIDNENRNIYYSTDIEFIKRIECNVYRIVTVHTPEKLSFLKRLVDNAKQSESENYFLAYLDIKKFSDETIDILPGIVGMDIIENEVIIMDYRFARALRRNDNFNSPLYMESEKIADMCRAYYNKIWEDISDETPISKRRYQGYVLYNGTTRKVHDDMDNIWKKIESNISIKK